VAACLSSPLSAFAQSDEQRAAARELATAGLEAFKAGKYDQALDGFTKAESLYHALPHLLFIARSHAKLNQYVKAREAYMKVIKEVLPANAPRAAKDAQTSASSEVSNIEPKIGRVTITVANKEQAKDLVVTVDGVAISSVLIGAPVPIDPGDHSIEGVATGLRGKAAVRVEPGQRQEVPLNLEQDASAVPPVAVGAAVVA
jgi:tetratricopeptide (TPR) repeat protein